MKNLFPSNSRELPVFPAVLGNMSISRLFATLASVTLTFNLPTSVHNLDLPIKAKKIHCVTHHDGIFRLFLALMNCTSLVMEQKIFFFSELSSSTYQKAKCQTSLDTSANWPRGYKTFSKLNSTEHEISNAHKFKYIKKFSFFLAQISLECYFSDS